MDRGIALDPLHARWRRLAWCRRVRGVDVDDQWLASFDRFRRDIVADIGEPPSGHIRLARISRERPFEYGNVRWGRARGGASHGVVRTGDPIACKHPLYSRWRGMIGRCHDRAHPAYRWYGARGISVCKRWRLSFWNYANDIGLPPFDGAQLDRANNDGNYEPSNVRWVTSAENNRNRRPLRRRRERVELLDVEFDSESWG